MNSIIKMIFLNLSLFQTLVIAQVNLADCPTPAEVNMELAAQFNTPTYTETKSRLPYWIPLLGIIGENTAVWAWDRYVLQKNYARIGPSTMKQNFEDGFTWDSNHYMINFFGHPYQGTLYYTTARSSGYGFYTSFLSTGIGSFTWEMFFEREQPSGNDLIVTTLGGAIWGEVFYRLGAWIEGDNPSTSQKITASTLSPMASGSRLWAERRGDFPKKFPIDLNLKAAAGSHIFSRYSYDSENVLDEATSEKRGDFFLGMNLKYGREGYNTQRPFDQFQLSYNQILGRNGTMMDVQTIGVLKNYALRHQENYIDLGLMLNYDILYGSLAEMNSTAITAGFTFNLKLSEEIRLKMFNAAGWLILGASDFNYEEILVAQDSSLAGEMRTYQIGTGIVFKNAFEFEWINHILFASKTNIIAQKTMPGSEPHYGANGWDIVARHDLALMYLFNKHWSIGAQSDLFWKFAAYKRFSPIARNLIYSWGFIRYNF